MPFSLLLIVSGNSWHSLSRRCIAPVFASVFRWTSLLCVFYMSLKSRPSELDFCARPFHWTQGFPALKYIFYVR